MNLNNLKFCINCKHFDRKDRTWCYSPKNGFDLVTGEYNHRSATILRMDPDYCGKDALWYEENAKTIETTGITKKSPWWKIW